jgi:hypothetical protein
MTGGGTLMVVGEPDAERGVLHGLRSLYYPDHRPLAAGVENLLRAYYRHDALLFGYTHGKEVFNADLAISAPGLLTRSYEARDRRALVVQFLRTGEEARWTIAQPLPKPEKDVPVSVTLPATFAPTAVYFVTPDAENFQDPVPLQFAITDGILRTALPEIRVHGTLILRD